jgi:hypothetical protein
LVEVIATFAVKGTNGVEIDERKKGGVYVFSSLAAIHGFLTALDEVSDLLKATRSVNKEEREETHSPIADNLTTSSENKEEREETHSPIAANLATNSKNKEEKEETHSPIANNFIFTNRSHGHLDKDFMAMVKCNISQQRWRLDLQFLFFLMEELGQVTFSTLRENSFLNWTIHLGIPCQVVHSRRKKYFKTDCFEMLSRSYCKGTFTAEQIRTELEK